MKNNKHYWIIAVLLIISYNWYWSYYEELYKSDGSIQAQQEYLAGEKSWEEVEHYFSRDVGRSDMRIMIECEEGCKKLFIDILESDTFKTAVESCMSSCTDRRIILRNKKEYAE